MNILPENMWKHLLKKFKSKSDAAIFLAQITVQTNFLQNVKNIDENKKIKYKRRKKNEDQSENNDTYYGRGIFYTKFNNIDIYKKCEEDLKIDLTTNPKIIEQSALLLPIAAWYWQYQNMARFLGDFKAINEFLQNENINLAQCQKLYGLYLNAIG